MLLLFDLYTNLKKNLKNLEIKRQCDLLSITYIFQLISITYIHKYTHTHIYIYIYIEINHQSCVSKKKKKKSKSKLSSQNLCYVIKNGLMG